METKMCADIKTTPLFTSLDRFYSNPERLQQLTDCLRGPDRVSLRVLDWLVTNYAKRLNIVYPWQDTSFNVYVAYKAQLKGYKKAEFDPFCRRERISYVDSKGNEFDTTIGQLCFFKWAILHGVTSYCMQHAKVIEADMLGAQEKRLSEQKRVREGGDSKFISNKVRRKELSTAAVKACTRTMINIKLRFV